MNAWRKYVEHELSFGQYQLKQLAAAIEKKSKLTLRFSIDQLTHKNEGDTKLKVMLTQTQVNRIKKHTAENRGIEINFSINQLKEISKTGGLLPLAALLPLIFAGVGAASGVGNMIGSKIHEKKQRDETERHNRAMEAKTAGSGLFLKREGSGLFLSKEGQGTHLDEADLSDLFNFLLKKTTT